jgi:hypothetical protein
MIRQFLRIEYELLRIEFIDEFRKLRRGKLAIVRGLEARS